MSRELKPIYFKDRADNRLDILKVTQFPTGEYNVELDMNSLLTYNDTLRLVVAYPYNSGIETAMFRVMDVLEEQGLDFELILPYLPYQRADRHIKSDNHTRLEMHLWFLSKLEAYNHLIKTDVYEIHNPATIKYNMFINNIETSNIPNALNYDFLVFPDKGAFQRFPKGGIKCVIFNKTRKNNSISFELKEPIDFTGKKVLIVDDIIDGGGTLETLVREHLSKAEYVDVFAVHGIFTGKTEPKLEGVRNIEVRFNYLKAHFKVEA